MERVIRSLFDFGACGSKKIRAHVSEPAGARCSQRGAASFARR